jgi:hypothetical protein
MAFFHFNIFRRRGHYSRISAAKKSRKEKEKLLSEQELRHHSRRIRDVGHSFGNLKYKGRSFLHG